MGTPSLPDLVRHLVLLAEIRGTAELAELRSASALIDRLSPLERARLEDELRAGRPDFSSLPPTAVTHLVRLARGQSQTVLDAARGALPSLLRRLLATNTLTADQALLLIRDCGVATAADLEFALQDQRLARMPPLALTRLQAAAPALLSELRPIPLGRATELLATALGLLEDHAPGLLDRSLTGEARRFEPLVRTPALAAASPDPVGVLDALCAAPGVEAVLHRTPRRAIVVIQQAEVDLRVAAPDEYGSVLFTSTGSPAHVMAVSARRRRPVLCPREEDVYANAGLPWIAPELRHATGEIEAAVGKQLPRLLTHEDIRGDLHMHSSYSDGQDSIESMVRGCLELGYAYLAITDHSASAAAARTLTLDQLDRQRDEIARLRDRYQGITILHGIEVDILPDGRLDFPDAVLERLDIVLASLHDAAKQDGAALTRRCVQAIRHPLVNVITHPANRLVGRRDGYPLNYPRIYEAAAEAGTALEIDGAPSHLDMDGEHAREAVTTGVTVTVDSDCHRARALRHQMTLGVGTARRGWVESRHVLNCRPLEEVRAFIGAKRHASRAGTP